MNVIDWLLIIICTSVCIVSASTDLKYKKIKNKVVVPAIIVSIALNTINSLVSHNLIPYLANLAFISCFGIILYAFHFMGAGDSKLLIMIISAIPVHLYQNRIRGSFGAIIILVYVFIVCMVYVFGESIVLSIIKHNKSPSIRKIGFKAFLLSYLRGIIIITAINEMMCLFLRDFYTNNPYAIMLMNFFIASKIPSIKALSNLYVNIALLVVDLIIAVVTPYGQRFARNDYRIILFFLLFLFIRHFLIEKYNYKVIPTADVKPGMILSTETTLLMTRSKVKGLPGISTEDLRSKLSSEEVDSIKRWAKSKYGSSEVMIVKFLPFGLFISLGTILFIVESVVRVLCV